MNPPEIQATAGQFLEAYSETLHSFCLPDRIAGQYELLNCISHSRHKEIYLLRDKQKNFYILKKEKNSENTRIRQEQQIFSILESSEASLPIPKYIDYFEESSWCYLLRTYIEGDSLASYPERHTTASYREITVFSLEICRLIKILHDRKPPIIHRDIKPENFVLQKDTHTLYLIDFDTARQYATDKERDTQPLGTPDLAAPEQFGFYQSNIRTDIYGIGKTLLFLITGSTSEDRLQDPSIPSGLRKIICRAIAFSPEKRYPNVAALQKDLQRYQRQSALILPLRRTILCTAVFSLGLFLGFTGSQLYRTAVPSGSGTSLPASTGAGLYNAPDSSDSLLSASEAKPVDLWQYQNQVDAIILSYYNADYDTMITLLEALVNDLYDDDALMWIPGEDYSSYETLPPDFWNISALTTIRLRLAYRDQILYTRLGSYADSQKNILILFDNALSLTDQNNGNLALYYYATLPTETRDNEYLYALSDLLALVCSGFDNSDNFVPPM